MGNKRYISIKVRGVFALVGILCALSASAQRYPFHNLSVDDGLIQSQAICMAQDNTGNLWVGTLGGLSRYDGRNFTNYTVRNGLPGNTVWALAVDNNNDIWIGGQTCLSQFDGKNFKRYNRPHTTPAPNSTQQVQIQNDTTWWRTQGDLYLISKGEINIFPTPGPQGFVSCILAEKTALWIAKESVVYNEHGNKVDTFRFTLPTDSKPPNVSAIFRDKQNNLWIGTNGGLYKLVNRQLLPYLLLSEPGAMPPVIQSITQDGDGALWIGTNAGVIKAGGGTIQSYNKHNGLSDNIIFSVLTDKEGNIWMASDGQGIFRFSGTQFAGLDETMGLPSAQIMALADNSRDSLFLGTYDAGLYIFKDGKVSPLSFPSSPVPAIITLCYAHNSKLWIGTRGRGLWSYDHNVFRQYVTPERNFPSNFINDLYEDPEKRMWIAFNKGVMLYEHDSFKTVDINNMSAQSFLAIGADSVLIATENGLLLYNAGSVIPFKTNTAIDSSVQCFTMQGRNLWAGSSDNGVIRYNLDTHSVLAINKSNGLRSDFIYNIIADNDGNIWVGTGFGIHCIKIGANDEPIVSFYGKAQGITGMESNMNAVVKLPDGSIWFGTTNGALHYQPHSAIVSSAPSSIILQSVKLAGESVMDHSYYDSSDNWYGIPYHLQLPFKKNNISFTFQAITLSGAQQVVYRYRMDGLDAPWSDWSPTNSVSYSALPPGMYTLHVQCQGANGQSAPELTYEFEIITPYQKTRWFRLAVLAACILSGILMQYIVNSRKQRRLRLLAKLRAEEQAKIRLRTAEDFHDEIGNKLTRINVLTNVLKNKIELNPETTRILNQIEDNTAQLYGGTRDILWSLKPSNDTLYEILNRIRDFGIELYQDTEVNFSLTGIEDKWSSYRLPMDMSRNLLMIFKEALNNCLKYSGAKNVSVVVSMKTKGVLQMVLKDDGKGFERQTVKKGNGINNMHIRAERLKGKLYLDSRPGKGTIMNLTFKIPPNR